MNIEEHNDGMVVNAYFSGMVTVSDLVRYLVQNCDPDAPVYTSSAKDRGNWEEIVGLINAAGEHVTIMTLPEADDEKDENAGPHICPDCQTKQFLPDGISGKN